MVKISTLIYLSLDTTNKMLENLAIYYRSNSHFVFLFCFFVSFLCYSNVRLDTPVKHVSLSPEIGQSSLHNVKLEIKSNTAHKSVHFPSMHATGDFVVAGDLNLYSCRCFSFMLE